VRAFPQGGGYFAGSFAVMALNNGSSIRYHGEDGNLLFLHFPPGGFLP
jgi:hypothetical protein